MKSVLFNDADFILFLSNWFLGMHLLAKHLDIKFSLVM